MSWQQGLGGAASGVAAGSLFGPVGGAIGGVLGGLGGLFGGGDDSAQQQIEAQKKLYQELLANYKGPESDPQYQQMLAGLAQTAQGGLTPQDRAAMLDEYSQAGQFARGREGAIAQRLQTRGGGVANSGQSEVLQQQAAQEAAQRAQGAGMQQAGIASARALQAKMGYLDTLSRNADSMNRYRLAAAGQLGGAYGNSANMYGAQSESGRMSLQSGLGNLTNMGIAMYGAKKPQQPQQGQPPQQDGGGYYSGNSEGYYGA
jgi:hypothetical protein